MQYTPHKCLIFFSGCYWYSQGGVLKQSGDTRGCSFRGKHSVDVDIHVIKQPCIARGLEACFPLRGSPVSLPEIERLSFQTLCRYEVRGELSAVRITGAPTHAKEGDFGCQIKQYKPQRWMRHMSERRGKFRLQSRRESDKAIGRDNFLFFFFLALFCTGWINFFPTMRVFFHAD